jgi:hypothetical protein
MHSESRVTAFVGAQEEKARGRSSIVDVRFNVQEVLAMYNLTYHTGALRGDGGAAASPNRNFKKNLVDPVISNVIRDLPLSRNQLMPSPLEF